MRASRRQGVTLIEITVVVIIVGLMAAIAVPGFRDMQRDERVRSAARDIADAFALARAHAIRSGDNHIVIFQGAMGVPPPDRLRTANTIDVVDDGTAADANCTIDASEVVYSVSPQGDQLSWGTTSTLAGETPVPNDPGFARANSATGSSFTDATVSAQTNTTSTFASWVVFQPDGIPRLMTPTSCANLGRSGQGGGTIYLTNGRRDYAVVLSPLGAVRVHQWVPDQGWSQ